MSQANCGIEWTTTAREYLAETDPKMYRQMRRDEALEAHVTRTGKAADELEQRLRDRSPGLQDNEIREIVMTEVIIPTATLK